MPSATADNSTTTGPSTSCPCVYASMARDTIFGTARFRALPRTVISASSDDQPPVGL